MNAEGWAPTTEGWTPTGDAGGGAGHAGAPATTGHTGGPTTGHACAPATTGHAGAPAPATAGRAGPPGASPESAGGAGSSARAPGGDAGPDGHRGTLRAVATYMRANPQVFVLLVICLVLGLGTFLAVVFGLLTAGSDQTTGEPSGAVLGVHLLAPATARLML